MEKPISIRLSVSEFAAISPCGPPCHEHSPMMILLLKYTPQQSTTARQATVDPVVVSTPTTAPFFVRIRQISAWRSVRFSQSSTALRILSWYAFLSACARSECTAGPLPVFSIRDWMNTSSIARPISPPSASSSRTRCPFAVPPIDGLHGIIASESRFSVVRSVLCPIRAHASAASHPACPAPTTTISNVSCKIALSFE